MTSNSKHDDPNRRAALFDEQEGRCFYCSTRMRPPPFTPQRTPHDTTLEHLIPFSEGGRRGFPNEVAACNGCNSSRGTTSWLLFYCLKELTRGTRAGARP